jgi:methionyl-tRNA formyltransferase
VISVLVLGNPKKWVYQETRALCRQLFDTVEGPTDWWDGDWIFSVLYPERIPGHNLQRAKKGAINFHPGPPEYPGTGCTNFALYDRVTTYGVTCHHMAPKVDAGPIIAVDRFPVFEFDTVQSLTERCYRHMMGQIERVLANLDEMTAASPCERWREGPPTTRPQLDALRRVTPEMDEAEVQRRIRATTYPGKPGPFVEVGGVRFTP